MNIAIVNQELILPDGYDQKFFETKNKMKTLQPTTEEKEEKKETQEAYKGPFKHDLCEGRIVG